MSIPNMITLLGLLLGLLPCAFSALDTTNTTGNALQVTCAYSISGPYSVLPRVLLYPLVLAAFFHPFALSLTMLLSSMASVHLSTMAYHHSTSVLDLDMFPAYTAVLLCLIISPALIFVLNTSEKIIKVLIVLAWITLLWTGAVSFAVGYNYIPPAQPCLDLSGRNVTSATNLTACVPLFSQCQALPMRSGQMPLLVDLESFFSEDLTHEWAIWGTILITIGTLVNFWLASIGNPFEFAYNYVNRRQLLEAIAKSFKLPFFIAFLGGIAIIFHMEPNMISWPATERRDAIGQWGPLVGFALLSLGAYCIELRWGHMMSLEYMMWGHMVSEEPLLE